MLAKYCTQNELQKALDKVNESFDGNIRFKKMTPNGKSIRFTLTVNSSKAKGARRGFSGRRIAAACWHVHGQFFDVLLNMIQPNAVIKTRSVDVFKCSNGEIVNNWQDENIGSRYNPLYYSEACDCYKD